jgi:hypothetical protein
MTDEPFIPIPPLDDEVSCDGINHHVKMEFVTYYTLPDNVWRKWANGTIEQVKEEVSKLKATVDDDTSVFIDYCCEACKEEEHE